MGWWDYTLPGFGQKLINDARNQYATPISAAVNPQSVQPAHGTRDYTVLLLLAGGTLLVLFMGKKFLSDVT